MSDSGINKKVPDEVIDFSFERLLSSTKPKSLATLEELLKTELKDANRQINMREPVALFFGGLLIAQNIALFFIVVWALNSNKMQDLQLIFSVLVTGTLTQSYFITKLIVDRLFTEISYKDKHRRFDKFDRDHKKD